MSQNNIIKIFINQPNENWVIDKLSKDIKNYISTQFWKGDISLVDTPQEADIIWLIASWCWDQIDRETLKSRYVVATISHIDPDKFNLNAFYKMDHYVDLYHVISDYTKQDLSAFTNKKIIKKHWWYDPRLKSHQRRPLSQIESDRVEIINKFELSPSTLFIGSFQRDSEGYDLSKPKLSKGPDLFFDFVKKVQKERDVCVVLAGWRRNWLVNKLKADNIPYLYREMPSFENLCHLYNMLDVYVVSSRVEGGPQAIIDCTYLDVPIISTDVGVASEYIHTDCVYSIENFENMSPYNAVDAICIATTSKTNRQIIDDVAYIGTTLLWEFKLEYLNDRNIKTTPS